MDAISLFRQCSPLFTALADDARQEIIVLLTGSKSLSVNDITAQMALSRPAVSHHLGILKDVGLVRVQKMGTKRMYSLSFEDKALLLRRLVDMVEDYHQTNR